jgi:Methyltransferase domain
MSGYVGSELELFSEARNWKAYFSRVLAPYVRGQVLEVGGGIGSNTPYLATPAVRGWTSVEPDRSLARRIAERAERHELPFDWTVVSGTIAALDPAARFETILYIDVLEHIADHRSELSRAALHLGAGGNLVALAPAHQFLFSPFDANIGHYRRYSRASLIALNPPGCRLCRCLMLDTAGLFVSLANRVLLRASMPTAAQIALWDKVLVPISRILDRLM